MPTHYLSSEKERLKNRPGLSNARARRMAKWVAFGFCLVVVGVIMTMYFGYGVPGRAWIVAEQ